MSNVLNAERYSQFLKYRLFFGFYPLCLVRRYETPNHTLMFSRAFCQPLVFAATSDWFIGLSCNAVIGQGTITLSCPCPTESYTCHFVAENFMGIAHVRYIKNLT